MVAVRMSATSGMLRSSVIWQSGSTLITPPDKASRRLFETRYSRKSGTRLTASIKESQPLASRQGDHLRRPDRQAPRRSQTRLKLRRANQRFPLAGIPLRFEHSLHGERSSCTLLPRNRQRSVRSGAIDAEWCHGLGMYGPRARSCRAATPPGSPRSNTDQREMAGAAQRNRAPRICWSQLLTFSPTDPAITERESVAFYLGGCQRKSPPKPWRDQHAGTRGKAFLLVAREQYGLPSRCTSQKFPARQYSKEKAPPKRG
jgi:hypothetical protein